MVVHRGDTNRRIHRPRASVESATCTINNNDAAAQFTLVKVVNNDDGGTAVPTDWTLSATGPTPISGVTGGTSITNAPVNAGAYTLSESGPAGYTASGWVCTGGGTQTGASIELAVGESATCTITNDDIPATLTLVKQVVNDDGGTAVAIGLDVRRGWSDTDERRRPEPPR